MVSNASDNLIFLSRIYRCLLLRLFFSSFNHQRTLLYAWVTEQLMFARFLRENYHINLVFQRLQVLNQAFGT